MDLLYQRWILLYFNITSLLQRPPSQKLPSSRNIVGVNGEQLLFTLPAQHNKHSLSPTLETFNVDILTI